MADFKLTSDEAAAGKYTPRAFAVELEHWLFELPHGHTGLPTVPRAVFDTFMHEVAHFVQDRATVRGVMDFIALWDQVAVVAEYVRGQGAVVTYPIVEPGGPGSRLPGHLAWAREVEVLRVKRQPRNKWTKDGPFWAFRDHRVDNRPLYLAGHPVPFPFVVTAWEDNDTHKAYHHGLGAWEIKEAYSVAVALLHGGKPKGVGSRFEYLAVERILMKSFGDVTPGQVVALCHWALQDNAPANTLFTLIEYFEEEYGRLPDPWEVYDAAKREALGRGFEENVRLALELLRETEARFAANLDVVRLFRWYGSHAERLLRLHLTPGRRFPLDTFLAADSREMEDGPRTAELERFFREVEVPMVVWPGGTFCAIGSDSDASDLVFLNRCVFDLTDRLWSGTAGEWECPVRGGCTLEIKDATDCLARPWRKGAIRPTCPYGAAANLLGLDGGKSLRWEPFPPP